MGLTVPTYDVLLAAPTADDPDATVEYRTKILNGDKLRAELEAPVHGLADFGAVPQHMFVMWVWAALLRQHHITDKWPEFKRRLLTYAKADEVSDAPDPTRTEAATDSASSSPESGPGSTGSTPTSTPA